ncbi:hypothetical protein GCM10011404_31260 [Sphingomonas prati]|uniref:Hedgehog/Intein (Hint) domain-containing protein n=1 Tax=Sphingomonas prati TaxID=1843237 RepID=A0A7W9F497_9SPHN|nr:hypothetical protein [Sphingomonas prati]GGE95864.1 hypothetical protein GCM10011404_31260 [Sphingomonas prati]
MSPGHRLYLHGHLFCAIDLVNGATIAQQPVDEVAYYHVEVESHDALIANGLPAETFLDVGNRLGFDHGLVTPLRPQLDAAGNEIAFAPTDRSGALLRRVRTEALAIATAMGWTRGHDPRITLTTDGQVAQAQTIDGRLHFHLAESSSVVTIRSAAAVRGGIYPAVTDTRRLGFQIFDLTVDGEQVDLTSEIFAAGTHGVESDGATAWRWTDGAAELRFARPVQHIAITPGELPTVLVPARADRAVAA